MNIGFIGCGNMANAIMSGIIDNKIEENNNIYAFDINTKKLIEYCELKSINAATSNTEVFDKCSVVIFCIKPQNFEEALSNLEIADSNKLFISIAAGTDIKKIEKLIGKSKKIARVMPNLNAAVAMSTSAVCFNENCEDSDKLTTENIFKSIGEIYEIDEKYFSAFSAACCCSPAFTFMYINALCEGAQKCGLDKKTALESAANSVIGSAKMLLNSDKEPDELVKMVCSPGGTTIEGVKSLNIDGFEKSIMNAVNASYQRDKELLNN